VCDFDFFMPFVSIRVHTVSVVVYYIVLLSPIAYRKCTPLYVKYMWLSVLVKWWNNYGRFKSRGVSAMRG